IEQAIDALPQLIEQLEAGTAPKADIYGLMERANAISRGEVVPAEEENEVDRKAAAITPEPEPEREPEVAADEETMPALVKEPAAEEPPSRAMDPVLYDIFRNEVEGHLETLQKYVEEAAGKSTPRPVGDPLLRALHTLNGSAAMAGAHAIAELVDPFEQYCKLVNEGGGKLAVEDVQLITELAAMVPQQLETLRTGGAAPEGLDELTTRVRRRLIDAPAAKRNAAPAGATAPPSVVDIRDLPDFDEELAEVFLEEANEVLEASDAALEKWSLAHDDQEQVAELQRLLHTLKGGARMAGIAPMGDLSHEIETLMAQVTDGHLPVSTRMFSLMQRALDRLHKMLEQVMARQPIVEAFDLVAEFQRLGGGDDRPEGESDVAP